MLKLFTCTAVAMSMFSISAQAGDISPNLNDWKAQASSAIGDKVKYPKTANLVGENGSNTFVVTVNKQGDILDVTKRVKAKMNYFDAASYRALKYVDLPALPSSYKADTYSFMVVLDYI